MNWLMFWSFGLLRLFCRFAMRFLRVCRRLTGFCLRFTLCLSEGFKVFLGAQVGYSMVSWDLVSYFIVRRDLVSYCMVSGDLVSYCLIFKMLFGAMKRV